MNDKIKLEIGRKIGRRKKHNNKRSREISCSLKLIDADYRSPSRIPLKC